jgi:Domain of unknown function (DU1801)
LGEVLTDEDRYTRIGLRRFGKGRRMANRSPEVDRFMEGLDHPMKEEIERLRAAILGSNERITEHIKWKAPSFRYAGEDRVTFRLHPAERAQLVFHRGVKVKGDAAEFAFEDDTGLLLWVAEDRAVVALRDAEARQGDLVEVVKRWVVS